MTRAEAAGRYARAMRDLMRAVIAGGPTGDAMRELAEAVEVLTRPEGEKTPDGHPRMHGVEWRSTGPA